MRGLRMYLACLNLLLIIAAAQGECNNDECKDDSNEPTGLLQSRLARKVKDIVEQNGTVQAEGDEKCDFQCYMDRYAGLKNYCKNDVKCAESHWKSHGKKEGRDCTCPGADEEECNWVCYLAAYKNLDKILTDQCNNRHPKDDAAQQECKMQLAEKHWYDRGKAEGKNCGCPWKTDAKNLVCHSWGDPHFTTSFFGEQFHFQGRGLFNLAMSQDMQFQVQGYMVPLFYEASVFGGFAVKTGSNVVTIINKDVKINGEAITDQYKSDGWRIFKDPKKGLTRVRYDSPEKDAVFNSQWAYFSRNPGFWLNLYIQMKTEKAAPHAICGKETERNPLPCSKSLFSTAEINTLCTMAGLLNCCNPPQFKFPVNTAEEACRRSGVDFDQASQKCIKLERNQYEYKACIIDYCATDGAEEVIPNAEQEVEQHTTSEQPPKPTTTTTTTTTGTTTTTTEACNFKCYLARYKDLQKAFGKDNVAAAEAHWHKTGQKEGRVCQCPRQHYMCHAWGDPHFTRSFFGDHFDYQGVGLFKLAETLDKSFVLQGFQVPLEIPASFFGGFAAKIGDFHVSIVDKSITIDGKLLKGAYNNQKGLWVSEDLSHVRYDSADKALTFNSQWIEFSSDFMKNRVQTFNHYFELVVLMDNRNMAEEGLCGTKERKPLACADSLFVQSDFDALCRMSGLEDCCNPEQPKNAALSPKESCEAAGMPYEAAAAKCDLVRESPAHFNACIIDYCATDGDDTVVKEAEAEKAMDDAAADMER